MRWTLVIDGAGLIGLSLTSWGFLELGVRCGLGTALGLLWAGAWLTGLAFWTAAGVRTRRPPPDLRHR